MGSTVRLAELFGAPLARELLLTGRTVKGREIRAAGVPISHAVVPRAQARARTYALARDMAAVSPNAMRVFRAHLAARDGARLDRALTDELAMHAEVFAHPDTRANILDSYPAPAEENEPA
jgi:polyketide biosynthesis enoyl-CoA hydratase PksI